MILFNARTIFWLEPSMYNDYNTNVFSKNITLTWRKRVPMRVVLFIEYHSHTRYVNCSGNCSGNNTVTQLRWVAYRQLSNSLRSCDYCNYKTRSTRVIIEITKIASLVS